ncbi:MAG: hypothetical protein ABJA67_03010 [Chthonomonadales bacterium]
MKAITIYNPWAMLIALSYKQYETRAWWANYRGKIAIHAGLSKEFLPSPAGVEEFASLLGIDESVAGKIIKLNAETLGHVVAVAELVDCVRSEKLRSEISDREHHLGDYSDKRYGWKLINIVPIKPVKVRGQQGLWDIDLAGQIEHVSKEIYSLSCSNLPAGQLTRIAADPLSISPEDLEG